MPGTLARQGLRAHPLWSRALAAEELAARLVLPLVVSDAVADRERVEGAPGLERLSMTELVREARSAARAGMAGLLLFGAVDRKDESAMLASDRDNIVVRAIRAAKEAAPDIAIATDVCVCAYTAHGQCVLFGRHGADVPATLERLGEIAVAHAEAGADLVIPSGMLDGSVGAVRGALDATKCAEVPVAAMAKIESAYYVTHRVAVGAVPIRERAVPLLSAGDPGAATARARRDIDAGADAVVVKPGWPALDIVAALRSATNAPIFSFHTADEHALFTLAAELALNPAAAELENVLAARRAGADLVISYGAWSVTETS